MSMRFAIVVHGGAGLHSQKSEATVNAVMERACLKAADVLRTQGGTALDAVEAAIRELEDDEALNAGYGSNLTTDKHIECDASLMESWGSFGAVGAVRGIRNPVTAARAVLERARHGRKTILGRVPPLLVCGEGAMTYVTGELQEADKTLLGPPVKVPNESLISPRAEREWSYWLERYRAASDPPIDQGTMGAGDTVGAVVICENGDAASGVSSGGLLLKYPGRIGEAAVYGAGCWAACERNQQGGVDGIALSVSGTGEQIIRGALGRTLGEACNPAICDDPMGMVTETFQNFMGYASAEEHVGQAAVNAGAVTLISESRGDGTSSVRLVVAFTTPSMAVATFSSEDPHPKMARLERNLMKPVPGGARGSGSENSDLPQSGFTPFVSFEMLPLPATLLSIIIPLTTSAAISAQATSNQLRGILPALHSAYTPTKAGTWKCLSGDKEIAWSKVNDDFCDCPDGSDEPGTSACANASFYCVNEGHVGSSIPSSRVNDGLCEKECCDGSDEPDGLCPNICEEVGKEYRQRLEAEMKIRRTGAKIRSTYVIFAEKERRRLEASIIAIKSELEAKRKEENHAKILLDHAESMSQASLTYKQQSPLYQSMTKHSHALKSLQEQYKALKAREEALSDVLRNLKQGYNPNYQDMAVLEAVKGWDGLDPDAPPEEHADGTTETKPATPSPPEEKWDQPAIDQLLRQDLVALLLQHDAHLAEGDSSTEDNVFDLESYVPDSLYPTYENARTQVVGWLTKLGVVRENGLTSEATASARDRHNTALNQLRNIERRLADEEEAITKIFNPNWFGGDGAWKKLDGLCLTKDTGEYTYEVCLFGQAMQKSNKGGGSHSLGRFNSWNTTAPIGSPEYYSRQVYKNGAKCWNGPERSITVDLVCGTENALLAISEPEKCEYRVTGTTPALCTPDNFGVSGDATAKKDDKPKDEL